MKRFLLLFLSLMTGCEAFMVKGCRGGWVNFTRRYPKNKISARINVEWYNDHENHKIIDTTEKNMWISNGTFSVYHDIHSSNLRVGIKEIQREGKFRLNSKKEVQLKLDNRCQEPLNKTAYKTDTIIIKCDKENKDDSRVKFFCKENGSICEDILSTKSAETKSNGTFSLTETESGFTVSISNVSPQHAGVYWCGVESTQGSYRAALRKIQLEVRGVSWIPIVAAVVCAALLGLLLFLVFRYKHSCCSKNKRIGEAHNVEDRAFDEIQERPLETGPGTALQALYVTANAPTNPSASPYYSTISAPTNPSASPYYSTINAPTNPSASPYYSTINAPTNPSASLDYSTITAHNISAEAGETYSTVRDQAQSAAYSTVNHPSRLPEDPFYSSVNHPQLQQT